jgi:hypothetical protein
MLTNLNHIDKRNKPYRKKHKENSGLDAPFTTDF